MDMVANMAPKVQEIAKYCAETHGIGDRELSAIFGYSEKAIRKLRSSEIFKAAVAQFGYQRWGDAYQINVDLPNEAASLQRVAQEQLKERIMSGGVETAQLVSLVTKMAPFFKQEKASSNPQVHIYTGPTVVDIDRTRKALMA